MGMGEGERRNWGLVYKMKKKKTGYNCGTLELVSQFVNP